MPVFPFTVYSTSPIPFSMVRHSCSFWGEECYISLGVVDDTTVLVDGSDSAEDQSSSCRTCNLLVDATLSLFLSVWLMALTRAVEVAPDASKSHSSRETLGPTVVTDSCQSTAKFGKNHGFSS